MIQFLPLESKEGHDAIAKTILKDQEFDSIVLISGVKVYLKSEAVIKILDTIGGPWRLFKIGFLLPRPARDRIYDIIARNRYRIFGKQDQYPVQYPEKRIS
jgi:predicted DCC family thiol-disulfide oxidoreductase YuxK